MADPVPKVPAGNGTGTNGKSVQTPRAPEGALTDPERDIPPAPAPADAPAPAAAAGGNGAKPAAAAPVISPTPSPPPVKTTFAERVAATGSGAASEDAQSAGVVRRHEDPHNGPFGRAQAQGGTDAVTRLARGETLAS